MDAHRILACLGVGAILVGGTTLAAPAQAVTCVTTSFAAYSSDYARVVDSTGGCSSVSVRHSFVPGSGTPAQWTSWVTGADIAQTPVKRELTGAQGRSNGGTPFSIPVSN